MNHATIAFANPEFEWGGKNVTCRRPSAKYTSELTLDTILTLTDLDNNIVGAGHIYELALYANVYNIPQSKLDLEHDPKCRNRLGLMEELDEVYNGYSDQEPVLVITFIPQER